MFIHISAKKKKEKEAQIILLGKIVILTLHDKEQI